MKKQTGVASRANSALNVRDFPEELRWLCRARASEEHLSLREWVIETLKAAASKKG